MRRAIVGLLFSMFLSAGLHGQEYAFKVLVNKGHNEVKSGDSWAPVRVGASLKPNDQLKVAENAYLGLVHATGRPIEVKKAGTYNVVELAAKVSGGSSVLNKYTDFILSENEQKSNRLVATGAVVRGENNLKVFLPEAHAAVVYGDHVYISWDTEKSKGPYVVTITSMFGDLLTTLETSDSVVLVNLYDKKFEHEDNILVAIQSKDDPSVKTDPAVMIKKISKADRDRINTALSQFNKSLAEENALNKLLLAGFYEENGLLIDALAAYLEAIKLEPGVESFKIQYNDFLIRNGIREVKK